MVAADPALEPLGDASAGESSKGETERLHIVVLHKLAESLAEWLKEREWIKVRLTVGRALARGRPVRAES